MSFELNITRKRSISLTLEEILLEACRYEAKAKGVSISALLNQWVFEKLEQSQVSEVMTCMAGRRHYFAKHKMEWDQKIQEMREELELAEKKRKYTEELEKQCMDENKWGEVDLLEGNI